FALRRDSREFLVENHGVDERAVGLQRETRDDADARVAAARVEAEGVAGRAAVEHDERAAVRARGGFDGGDERRAEAAPAVRAAHKKFLEFGAMAAVGLRRKRELR